MKKLLYAVFLSSLILTATAFAAQTPEPSVDDPITPVDAPKAMITGSSEPSARIVVTGGSYEISPVTVEDDGSFSITVALSQEATNTFHITAKNGDDEQSDAVTVVIVESAAEAAASEASGGGDHTAPSAPELDYENVETNELEYTITGAGEADADIFINDIDSGENVDKDGNIEITVDLSGDDTQDKFKLALQDTAGNIGSSTTIYVTSSAAGSISNESAGADNTDTEIFTDVPGHWGKTYILELYNNGIVSGYGDGTFGPDNAVTRAQILKIAIEAFGVPEADVEAEFSDISNSDWYVDYVNAGYSHGIVEGYSNGTFRPNNQVTRAAALKIILEAAGKSDLNSSEYSNFPDISDDDWFAKYAAYAKHAGLVSGYSDGEFKGGQSITRAEVCKIVSQVMSIEID